MKHVKRLNEKVRLTDTVSTSVAAKLLGVSTMTVVRLCDNGELPYVRRVICKPPGERVIPVSSIMKFATSRGWDIHPMYLEDSNV